MLLESPSMAVLLESMTEKGATPRVVGNRDPHRRTREPLQPMVRAAAANERSGCAARVHRHGDQVDFGDLLPVHRRPVRVAFAQDLQLATRPTTGARQEFESVAVARGL